MLSAMERRRKKFSKETNDKIASDSLLDTALLSRSQDSQTLTILKSSHQERLKLYKRIKESDSLNTAEHGLRKLREIIISIFDEHKHDQAFLEFVMDVYSYSYDFFMKQGQFFKVGSIILHFVVENLHEFAIQKGFIHLYIIYLSHWDNDMNKAIDSMLRYGLTDRKLLKLSLIYCSMDTSPNEWFKELKTLKDDRYYLVINFLKTTGKISEMQRRCLYTCQAAYNQLSLNAFQDVWLDAFPFENDIIEEIKTKYQLERKQKGHDTIYFKKRS